MRLLLDTHAFLWYATNSPELSSAAERVISDPDNHIAVSVASFWEIGIKQGLGKLRVLDLDELVRRCQMQSIAILGIQTQHVRLLPSLPQYHRDPFDRMVVVQAQHEGLSVVSADTQLDAYGIQRIW